MTLPLTYNWRNLLARKLSTGLTFTVVAVVVLVLALLLSFAAGIRASLVSSGSDRNLIVLTPGSTAESTSIIRPDETAGLHMTPGLARLETELHGLQADTPLLSQEVCVQTTLWRQDGSAANVAVRGVDDVARLVHPEIRLVAGRWLQQGALEALVGVAARERFVNLDLDREILLGRQTNRAYKIVGIFEAGGEALESEVFTPRTILIDSYQRRFISSVCLRLAHPAAADEAIKYINGPAVGLTARTETKYYEELYAKTREIVVLTTILVGIMGIGAAFAVANTMYAAVDGRRREIAMLRTIGFSRAAIMLSFVLESLLICALACGVGLAGSVALSGTQQDFLSDTTWTVLAYRLQITPGIAATALLAAALVGVAGALAPAVRAARTNILQAMRKG